MQHGMYHCKGEVSLERVLFGLLRVLGCKLWPVGQLVRSTFMMSFSARNLTGFPAHWIVYKWA